MTAVIHVDLHCHSSLSDGGLPPSGVARRMADAGVQWAALTDHNTVAGNDLFRRACEEEGIHVVNGLEIDVRSTEGPLHLLAYGMDCHHSKLLHVLYTLRHPLRSSARYWLTRARSYPRRSGALVEVVGAPPAHHGLPEVEEAIAVVHEAGGITCLAHPLTVIPDVDRLERLLAWLKPRGLDGLEAFYKPYAESTQRFLVGIAEGRGLLVTGGSDYHGSRDPLEPRPGVDMPLAHWERFVAALGGE